MSEVVFTGRVAGGEGVVGRSVTGTVMSTGTETVGVVGLSLVFGSSVTSWPLVFSWFSEASPGAER